MSIYMLTDKLGITSDKYNWILIEEPKRRTDSPNHYKGKHSYFPNFRLMSRAIVDIKLKEIIALTHSGEPLLSEIESKLEQFLQETITKEK